MEFKIVEFVEVEIFNVELSNTVVLIFESSTFQNVDNVEFLIVVTPVVEAMIESTSDGEYKL